MSEIFLSSVRKRLELASRETCVFQKIRVYSKTVWLASILMLNKGLHTKKKKKIITTKGRNTVANDIITFDVFLTPRLC